MVRLDRGLDPLCPNVCIFCSIFNVWGKAPNMLYKRWEGFIFSTQTLHNAFLQSKVYVSPVQYDYVWNIDDLRVELTVLISRGACPVQRDTGPYTDRGRGLWLRAADGLVCVHRAWCFVVTESEAMHPFDPSQDVRRRRRGQGWRITGTGAGIMDRPRSVFLLNTLLTTRGPM